MAEPSNPRVKGYLGFIPGQAPNDFRLRAVDRQKIYVSIVDQILEGIRTGAFPPGAALPAERLLAAEFNVSRGSLREAIRVLEHAGCLRGADGQRHLRHQRLPLQGHAPAHAGDAGRRREPAGRDRTRRAVEPLTASEAARHRHSRDVTQLAQDDQGAGCGGRPRRGSFRYRPRVPRPRRRGTHNPVMVAVMDTIAAVMRQPIWRDFSRRVRGGRSPRRRSSISTAGSSPPSRRATPTGRPPPCRSTWRPSSAGCSTRWRIDGVGAAGLPQAFAVQSWASASSSALRASPRARQ